jgi:hypothetical protein
MSLNIELLESSFAQIKGKRPRGKENWRVEENKI